LFVHFFNNNNQRLGGDVFNRNWRSYKYGFGKLEYEFWFGLHPVRKLIANSGLELKVDVWDIYGKKYTAHYLNFSIGSEDERYRLNASGYSEADSNLTDFLKFSNGLPFQTKDRPFYSTEDSVAQCIKEFGGAWWYGATRTITERCVNGAPLTQKYGYFSKRHGAINVYERESLKFKCGPFKICSSWRTKRTILVTNVVMKVRSKEVYCGKPRTRLEKDALLLSRRYPGLFTKNSGDSGPLAPYEGSEDL